jgi:hypothetical protein
LRNILLLIPLLWLAMPLWSVQPLDSDRLAPQVVAELIDSLQFTHPVVVDVNCGEWTPALERELRKQLLQAGVDVREISLGLLKDSSEYLPLAMESDFGVNGEMLLQMLKLPQADYLELTLEQSVETGEKRNILSYSRYRMPVYRFVLKQIAMPEQRLQALQEYKLNGEPEVENPGSLLAMKWYEPILAGAILGSLIYMLWTLK